MKKKSMNHGAQKRRTQPRLETLVFRKEIFVFFEFCITIRDARRSCLSRNHTTAPITSKEYVRCSILRVKP